MRTLYTKGITVLELVMIVAIVGILVAVVVGPLARFRDTQALQHTTNSVLAVLNDARTKTLAAVNDTSYSVKIESTRVTVFTGTTYSASAVSNEVYLFETPVTAVWSIGGGSVISFTRLTGASSVHGTLTLSIPSGQSKTIGISSLGALSKE